jgi:hypothetical protein
MAKNFQGVLVNPKSARFTTGDLSEMQEPREYDRKLSVIRATLPDYEKWYQEIVNLPARKWRAAIDEKLTQLCDADARAINLQ